VSFVEVIARKRDGCALSRQEIRQVVRGACDGSLPAEQIAALLMAICCRGMDADETHWLTEEMLRSGESWELHRLRPDVVDKHSTGGVGDTVSLLFAPLLAAIGVPVAMMAGRGLGHSQGTLDKLAAIPGFVCDHDRDGLLRLIDRCGAAIVAQTAAIAPADRVLYALRDLTGSVPSLPLIVSSIMSKKLALGAASLVLDVKWGSGAFRKTVAAARELALALRDVAQASGMGCEALITDMNQPLGPAIGTAVEVAAARDVLAGGGDPRLAAVTLALGEAALQLCGWPRERAAERLRAALADGSALAAWNEMVTAHGGDPDPEGLPCAAQRVEVPSNAAGWLAAVDGEALGWVAVDLGAGRRSAEEPLDYGAGLVVHVRLGDRVAAGQPLATLLVGRRPVEVAVLTERVRACFRLTGERVEPPTLMLGPPDQISS
jgi:pyrimidine-nucleoside phosphorylase